MMKRGHDVEAAPSSWRRRTVMEHYAGIDVSLELSSVCVVDAQGKIVKEAKVASEPEAVVAFFEALGFAVKRIGLEAGPLSQWLHAGLKEAGFETVLLETRHVKAALSAMTVKTDRKDARGLAQLLRMGWFQQVHAKSMASREVRALLVGRKQLLGRLIDVELSIRGILRGVGLKVGAVTRKGFEARIRELVTGQATLELIAEAMLSARAALKAEYEKLHQAVLAIVREDAVCRRLMTVPSVGPLVAITYKSALDDPSRIAKSKAAGSCESSDRNGLPEGSPMPLNSKAITRRAVVRGGTLLVGATTLSTLPLTAFAQGRSLSPVAKSAGGVVEKTATGGGRKGVMLMNRIAPSSSDLYIANVDGSGERKFLDTPAFDYNATFAADGQSVVFTSERNGDGNSDVFRCSVDGTGIQPLVTGPAVDDAAVL